LMNVFVTTFGISGGPHETVIGISVRHDSSPTAQQLLQPMPTESIDSLIIHQMAAPAATTPLATKYEVMIGDHSSLVGNTSYS